jgi:hypothetical protein
MAATPDDVVRLRALANYNGTDPYDDQQLAAMIDGSSIYRSAARLWDEKAASLSEVVDISESGSSRKMGDTHKNALAMAKYFRGLAEDEEEAPVETSRNARTRAIIREG